MGYYKLEYIWIDGLGKPRSKTKVVNRLYDNINDLPEWNYDGSSTSQATGSDSEVIIKPKAWFPDPFRGADKFGHKLVLCDTYLPNGDPHPTNTRVIAEKIFNSNKELKPRFGIEQEFFLSKDGLPIGLPINKKNPPPQGNYYCGTGAENIYGRECIENAFDNCLKAGLNLTGLNSEVAPSQWEFQIDEYGINVCDQLYIMRYILDRTAENYGWYIDFYPKPVDGDWNGSGCHINFSTGPMRNVETSGYEEILNAIKKLEKNHSKHMKNYGEGNEKRMTGLHETAKYDEFTYGVANRGASVRIPRETERLKCGYFEDRRPSSNMDPYIATSLIFETCCL